MSKPREEVSDKAYYKDIHFLYDIIHSLRSIEELKLFLKDILTKSELRMLKRRWHIACLLQEGHDVRTVAQKSQTSTQTVSRIKQIIDEGNGGLNLALERSNQVERNEKSDRYKVRGSSKYVKSWF